MRTLMLILAMLATLALTTTPAAARPCLSLSQVQAKHPGQYAKYRSVDGRKCYYVGQRVPAKSEFSLPATASSRGGVKNTHGWKVESSKQPFSVERCQGHQVLESFKPKAGCAGSIPAALSPRETNHASEPSRPPVKAIRTAYSATLDHDEILSMCGGPCPDFRNVDLYGMQARLEAAHAAFMFLQAMR